jgi:membrane-associated phospholipid phosphatase
LNPILRKFFFALFLLSTCAIPAAAQQSADQNVQPGPSPSGTTPLDGTFPHPNETRFLQHLAEDQKNIWTSPARLNAGDAKWLAPSGGILAGLLVTDPQSSYAMRLGNLNRWNTLSNAGLASAAGMTGALYFWGRWTHNERARETGVLVTEAMINAFAVDQALAYSTGRLRPLDSHFQNVFFHGGNSFPSDHSALTWAFASVVAQEYPHWPAQLGAYGLAAAVSLARAGSEQHFLSDVFVGGLLGYQIGRSIYKQRHNREIDDDLKIVAEQTTAPRPGNVGSTYVPLDSWIYPALERLVATGYIDTAFLGLRPWTRISCANMLVEMSNKVENNTDLPPQIAQLQKSLNFEFADELAALEGRPVDAIQIDSVYTRVLDIAGRPLNDSYHFGQTLINDYGRPYWQGVNNVTGFSTSANDGRFAFYVDGEYQYAPTIPAYPLSVRQVIANVDVNPLQPAATVSANRFRLLDTYASAKYAGIDFSVGKQSLWWGPTQSGSMLISDNAEPFWMLRINRAEPINIPGLSKLLGPFRTDNYIGPLSGHKFPAGAYMFGQKISFKPTENLEIGFTRNDVFGGQGHVPITFGSFWNSFTSFTDVSPQTKFSRNDPGARHASFDFNYRLPFVRNWLTLYTDSIVHDDVSPISAPRRSAINPGLYLSHFPHIPKLELRVEAVNTDPPTHASTGGEFIYWEIIYHDVYINNRNLIGNWIGREGKGYQGWLTYWLSPKSSIQLGVRNSKIAGDFIPGGSTQWDASLSANFWVRKQFEVQPFIQYENWLLPVLAPTRQTDVATSLQLTWWPALKWKR